MKQQLTMLALLLAVAMPVLAQGGNHAVIPWDYHVETPGFMSNRGDTPKIVWSDIISVPVASALLVHFDTVELGSLDDKIVLTSLKDGCVQELDQRALKRWGGHSAWFNGNQLRVSLRLAPGSTGKLAIRKVAAEATSGTSGTSSVSGQRNGNCQLPDPRTSSNDPAVFRLVSNGTIARPSMCTGFLIGSDNTFLSAGHCAEGPAPATNIAQFNVPLSPAGQAGPILGNNFCGSLIPNQCGFSVNHPSPQNQYPVDQSTLIFTNTDGGNDWLVGRLHPNGSGQTAFSNQGSFKTLATSMPIGLPTLSKTGYGISADSSLHGAQKTATGGSFSFALELFHFVAGSKGDSGGPIMINNTGVVVGIATRGIGDCSNSGSGTRVTRGNLQAAINSVQGCAAVSLPSSTGGASHPIACDFTVFDINPVQNKWVGVGISSAVDWDISIETTVSLLAGDACDFLLANGHQGAVSPVSGELDRFSSLPVPAFADHIEAVPLAIGTPKYETWDPSDVLRIFEFEVPSGGLFGPLQYHVNVAGNNNLKWRLYEPGTSPDFRPRNSSTAVGGTRVVGAGTETVILDAGWHCIAVFKDGGPSTMNPDSFSVQVCGLGPVTATPPTGLNVPNNGTVAVTGGCTPFNSNVTAGVWNVIGIAANGTTTEWDMALGSATTGGVSSFTVGADFALANGGDGAMGPDDGTFMRMLGSGSGVAQHASATSLFWSNGLVTIGSGEFFGLRDIPVSTAGSYTVTVSGDPDVHWRLYEPSGDAAWFDDTNNVVASGTANGVPQAIALGTGNHALLLYRRNGPSGDAATLLASLCWSPSMALGTTGAGTSLSACQPFSFIPRAGRWNAVGVASVSNWNLAVGPTISNESGSKTDFVVANGHLGTVSPSSGVAIPLSFSSSALINHAPTHTLALGALRLGQFRPSRAVEMLEFEAIHDADYNIRLSGNSSLGWRLFGPGADASFRARNTAMHSGTADGTVHTVHLAPGWYGLAVFHDGGPVSSSILYQTRVSAVPHPLPTGTSLSPASALVGGPPLTLTVNGSGFISSSEVLWDGAPLATSWLNANQVEAIVPSSLLGTAGTAIVTVSNPLPGGGVSAGLTFTINNPVPVLWGVSHSPILAGSPSLYMSVYGSGFVPGATLVWNGTALSTSFDTSMQLTAYVSMSWLEYAGTATVEVVNPTPGGGTSAPLTINILPPIITALSPSNIPQMSTTSTGVNVTITGQYFHSGTVVHADGFALPTTYLGPTSLMVLVDASILGTQRRGAVAIAVENGHFAMSNAMALTVGGTAGNAGTVSRHPLAPYPGEPYSAYLEGGAPNRPLVLLADLSNPTPVTSWPDPSANMILSVRDQPGTNWFVLADGIGVFQPADGSSCNANGVFELGGFVLPTTPLGIDMTVQGAYIDPSSPVGFRLTWARFPDRL